MRKKFFISLIFSIALFSFIFNKKNSDFAANICGDNLISNASFEIINNNYNINTQNDMLENYIIGVVAAEMPVTFCTEALKAQAVAARTYCIKNSSDINNINPNEIYQAYYSIDELKKKWGENFNLYYEKIKNAVLSTKSLIMTYDGKTITAVFHSMSGGVTEDSKNIWGTYVPYLVSKSSSIEENAPNFITKVILSHEDFKNKLSPYYKDITAKDFKITGKSRAGYVKKVLIGNVETTGEMIRKIFSLRSSCFDFFYDDKKIVFTVRGYGHGVGMSQYGAEFMAQSGKKYDEILKYYYTGVEINPYIP